MDYTKYSAFVFLLLLSSGSSLLPKNSKISGGTIIDPADRPTYKYISYIPWSTPCAVFIVTPYYALTAAHCVEVYANDPTPSIRITLHPEYNNVTGSNDIAVIYVQPPVVFDDNVGTIPISGKSVSEGTVCRVVSERNGDRVQMTYMDVTVQPHTNCEGLLEGQLCVTPAGLCKGDGGDPLVLNGELVGIGLSDINCASKSYDTYLDISKYKTWIEENTVDPETH